MWRSNCTVLPQTTHFLCQPISGDDIDAGQVIEQPIIFRTNANSRILATPDSIGG